MVFFGLIFQGKYEYVRLRGSILIFTQYFQVGYDDVAMIRYKSEYIRKMGLGGGMVWALIKWPKRMCATTVLDKSDKNLMLPAL